MAKRKSKKTLLRIRKSLTGKANRPVLLTFVGAFIAFGLVVVLVTNAATTVTAGTTGILASGLKNGSGQVMCLDDYQNSSTVGNPINIYPCNKADSAQKFTSYSDGTIRIHGRCVGVSGNSNGNGARMVLANCSGSNWTKFRRHTDPRNSLNDLVVVANNSCVDVYQSRTANSSEVDQWGCDDTNAQVWGWVTGTAAIQTGGSLHNANCSYIGGYNEPNDGGCYAWVGANQANNNHFSATGVQADFSQGNPVCTSGCGHSIVEFMVSDATNKNTIEYGWGVQPGATKPTIGIGLWANGKPLDANANFVSENSTLKPGSAVTPGAIGTFKIWFNPATGRWNLYYNGTWLGFFPESVFTSRGTSYTSIGWLQVFGEVVQPSLNVGHMQMGNGVLGSQAGSASVSNYQLINANVPAQLTGFFVDAKSSFYDQGNTSSTGFTYGGPGIF